MIPIFLATSTWLVGNGWDYDEIGILLGKFR